MASPKKVTLYHNPRCGKSREALKILTEKGVQVDVVLYLEQPLSAEDLAAVLKKAGLKAGDLIRKGEEAYKTLDPKAPADHPQWLAAMVKHPILMERPIAVCGSKAVVGRPPERVLEIL